MARRTDKVTDAELAVLEVLWEKGASSARDIAERLYPPGGPAEMATVQKLLHRLEKKRHVLRDRSERTHIFSSTASREEFSAAQLAGLADKLSAGSVTPLILHLIETHKLSSEERSQIREMLLKRRRGVKGDRS